VEVIDVGVLLYAISTQNTQFALPYTCCFELFVSSASYCGSFSLREMYIPSLSLVGQLHQTSIYGGYFHKRHDFHPRYGTVPMPHSYARTIYGSNF
jgi:hypothetical protein